MGYKQYSDSYLMSLSKTQIIEQLRVAEHNLFAIEEALENSANAAKVIYENDKRQKELLMEAVDGFRMLGKELDDKCELNLECDKCPLRNGGNCRSWKHTKEVKALVEGKQKSIYSK